MSKAPDYVNPADWPPPRGYNNGVAYDVSAATRLVFLAGQVGWDRTQRLVSDRFEEQFDQALANLLATVAASGGEPASIGKLTIYVTDTAEYMQARKAIGERYRRRMHGHYPAMALVEVKALLEPGAKVEIEGIACIEAPPR